MNKSTVNLLELGGILQARLGNGKAVIPIDGGIADGGGVPTWNRADPWVTPPPGAEILDLQNVGINPASLALPAVGATSTVLSFQAPEGYDCEFHGYNVNFTGPGFTDFSGDIHWDFTVDSKPLRGLTNILNQRGSSNIPRNTYPASLRLRSGQTLVITVTHVANVGLNGNVVAGVLGYMYPSVGLQ